MREAAGGRKKRLYPFLVAGALQPPINTPTPPAPGAGGGPLDVPIGKSGLPGGVIV